MAIKFPRRRPDGLEIVHPDDLNENLKEFVDEINGNIDSDNIKASSADGKVDKRFLSDQCFNEVFQSNFDDVGTLEGSVSGLSVSHSTTGYIKEDDDGNKMPSVEFRAEADGWAIVDFSVAFVWEGNGARDYTDISRMMSMEEKYYYPFQDPYDGYYQRPQVFNLEKPFGGWSAVSGGPAFPPGRVLLLREHPRPHFKIVNYYTGGLLMNYGNFPQGRWHPEPIDVHGVAFKVEVNGIDICTSGWLFNGNERHGIHLCGAIPIVAGKNTISSSVRAATVKSTKSSRIGLGAGLLTEGESPPEPFDGDHAAKFSGNIAIAGEDGLSPIPEFRNFKVSVAADHYQDPGGSKSITFQSGIGCTITNSNLVVQYRKA